jgi:hypothetical protein
VKIFFERYQSAVMAVDRVNGISVDDKPIKIDYRQRSC